MELFKTIIDSCFFQVKRGGVLGKKYNVSLVIHERDISVDAFNLYESDLSHCHVDLPYELIRNIYVETIEGKESVIIDYKSDSLISSNSKKKLVLWGISEPIKWAELIDNMRSKHMENLHEARIKEQQQIIKREEELIRQEKEAEQYYQNCYSFHIKTETPLYIFSTEKNKIVALYIDDNKALNFLHINGYSQEESVGTIPYGKIHYYEKAGSVSYATDIHGSYSSFGGSFSGGYYSKLATAVGGALFGMMGMTAGALLTYKPTNQTEKATNISLDSEVIKIDDRNIILNFYSDIKRQYIDIELPQEIYNFLQTYLPEKKYGIVEELERKAVIHQSASAIHSGAVLRHTSPDSVTIPSENQADSMDVFKAKVAKLRMMREAELLSEEEFVEERKKLLELI